MKSVPSPVFFSHSRFPSPLLSPDGDTGAAPLAAPPTPPAPGSGPTGEGPTGSTISISREEYDKFVAARAEAEAQKAKVKEFEDLDGQMKMMLRPEGADPSKLAASARNLMKRAGYDDAQIEEYVKTMLQPDEGAGPEATGAGKKKKEREEEGEGENETQLRIQQLEAKARAAELEGLRTKLNNSVAGALSTNSTLADTIKKLVKLNSDPDSGKSNVEYENGLKKTLQDEILLRTKERLKARKDASNGQWRDSWIEEEAGKVAEETAAKYRSIVPNPDRLGPSTLSFEEHITRAKPVAPPEYKKGMSVSQVQAQARDYATDVLLRGGLEGEESKV